MACFALPIQPKIVSGVNSEGADTIASSCWHHFASQQDETRPMNSDDRAMGKEHEAETQSMHA